jgi:alkyl sulfatase BDS1-like metallo-beta-lactamase superfamily hydrolase
MQSEQKLLIAYFSAAVLLIFGSVASAQDERLFYRGDLDDKKVEAPNGAIVNKDYRNFIIGGAFGTAQTIKVRDGVHSIIGYSLSNYTFIEGETGLIIFDAGQSVGMGKETLAMIREVSDKPIVAIIYSHHHYTGGAQVYVEEGGGKNVKVFGHPDVDRNLQSSTGALGQMQYRRAGIQLGFYLPHEGPDAVFGPAEPTFDDPDLGAIGHVPVNHPVTDGEEVVIDGIRAVFYHAVSDTRDSLIVHFPDLDLVLHNAAVTPLAFPLYTLRGDFYRTPVELISGIDKLREINAKYTVGCHGAPITTREEGYDIATAHRDAYAFIYNQSIRAINNGMTPDQMANTIRLPKHLEEHPWLYPGYIDNEYSVRGQYRGIVGWYAEDTADLHPPTPEELSGAIVNGFGGADELIDSAEKAYREKKYNLTAKLLSYVLAVEPDNKTARQLKADALRSMAQTTRSGIQTRNFLLTHALHLEGKLDWTKPPEVSFFGLPTVDAVLATPPGTYLKLLEVQIDPEKSAGLEKVVKVTFTDLNRSWGLQVRHGVAEVTENVPQKVDVTLKLPRDVWAQIALGEITIEEAITSGKASVKGSQKALTAVFASFG